MKNWFKKRYCQVTYIPKNWEIRMQDGRMQIFLDEWVTL
jgi:hypothetical protein